MLILTAFVILFAVAMIGHCVHMLRQAEQATARIIAAKAMLNEA